MLPAAPSAPSDSELAVQGKFQEFVSGTFYKQMLKALRAAEKPPAYMNGGQAEKIFRSQLDEIVTDSLAKRPGEKMADTLFQQFAVQHPDLVRR